MLNQSSGRRSALGPLRKLTQPRLDGQFLAVPEELELHVAPHRRPGRRPRELVGRAKSVLDASLSYATWEEAVAAGNPDAGTPLPNALGVSPAEGTSDAELVAAVNDASPDADALTRDDAADNTPGVAQVRQSFQVIFLLYGLVVPLVTGLFFLILTLQKRSALVLLRAVGATSSVLVRALLMQVLIVVGAGLAIGVALYAPLSRARIGTLALRFDPTAVVVWSIVLVVLGSVSALVSVRRVVRIDPIEATTGGGLR